MSGSGGGAAMPNMLLATVTLCGSMRFAEETDEWNERLTMMGFTVHRAGGMPSGAKPQGPTWKATVDAHHLRKVMHSQITLVVNQGGYVGESTVREMLFAQDLGRRVWFAHPTLVVPEAAQVGFSAENPSHKAFAPLTPMSLGDAYPFELYHYAGDLYSALRLAGEHYGERRFMPNVRAIRGLPTHPAGNA